MHYKRQAHGMVTVGNYVYCCGGLDGQHILNSCERFDLQTEKWSLDVPKMQVEKFSMTMMLMDKKWLYSFGGATYSFHNELKNFEIERLDTQKLDQWHRIVVECDMKSCC